MKPTRRNVLVRRIKFTERRYGSLVLPDTGYIEDLDKPRLGIVLEVGPECREVKALDKVLIEPGVGMELAYQPDPGMLFDEEVWDAVIVSEDNVICVIEKVDADALGEEAGVQQLIGGVEVKGDYNG